MMAGEIGASVIVVKEIEVPPAMVVLADKVSAYIDPETGEWTEKMNNKRHRTPYYADSDFAAASTTEAEETDLSDDDTSVIATPDFPPELGSRPALLLPYTHRLANTNPNRPTAQSSPSINPIDSELALFSMEPEPSLDDDDDADVEDSVPDVLEDIPDLSLDIEITPVYKPRPVRRRVHITTGPPAAVRPPRRAHKNKDKKVAQSWHTTSSSTTNVASHEPLSLVPNKEDAKAHQKRMARDKRREEKRKALVALAESGVPAVADQLAVSPQSVTSEVTESLQEIDDSDPVLVAGLASLHVAVQSADVVVLDEVPTIKKSSESGGPINAAEGAVMTLADSKEPRLIVEALVVRKMSLEEGFLDFEGFSLT